ncbi:hypothetical protein [Rhodococcus chondri]|uniref:Secreted protein n=1 Tax=Rhodococcus chondri TaxID=3065941 RepID=A0ABU7JX69_9NOCA|nr:hypothetical protein [Rhodococcus sp. CC-R104]MEE2034624.1 hypothetical protein [Rhodococcus sp. CC-R104]
MLTLAAGIAVGSAGAAAAQPVALPTPIAPTNVSTTWCTNPPPFAHLSIIACLASIISTGSAAVGSSSPLPWK